MKSKFEIGYIVKIKPRFDQSTIVVKKELYSIKDLLDQILFIR